MSSVLHAPNLKHFITGTQNSTKYALDVSISNVAVAMSAIPPAVLVALQTMTNWAVSYPLTTREIYTYRNVSAVTLATCTINYTDATKAFMTDGTWTVP